MPVTRPDRRPVATVNDLKTLNEDEIVEGYRDGMVNFPCGENRSRSYWHGWCNAQRDLGLAPETFASAQLARQFRADEELINAARAKAIDEFASQLSPSMRAH